MKRYLSIILALLIALSSISAGFFVSAADQAEKYDTEAYYDLVYKGYQSQLDGPEWELATNEYYMPLDEYANQWTNDFFYGFATRITDNELTKERYTEILVQFMSLLDMSTTEMIANQVEADTTKSLRDYALDIGDILTGTITLDAAFNQEATTAMKSVATALGLTWGAADVTADSLEALQYADWLLKDYNSHALFLTAIVNNAEDSNLRNAASDLLLFSQKVFYIRMNEIDEIGESVEFYLGKDVFFDTIVLDKMCSGAGPLDISNADVKILSLFKAAYTLIENAASAGSKLGVFAADCIIGASNLINRSQEIIALNYIKKALTTEGTNLKKEICNADAHEKIRELSTIVTDLLYLNYRAFYDMHEMEINEAQFASIVIRLNGQATEIDEVFKKYEKIVLMAINNIEDIFPDWDDFVLAPVQENSISIDWLTGHWFEQFIQYSQVLRFYEDGTFESYGLDMYHNEDYSVIDYERYALYYDELYHSGTYSISGDQLKIYPNDWKDYKTTYYTLTYLKKEDHPEITDWDTARNIPTDQWFFFETSWEPDPSLDSDNALYLAVNDEFVSSYEIFGGKQERHSTQQELPDITITEVKASSKRYVDTLRNINAVATPPAFGDQSNGYCFLFDVDSNGTDELFVIYTKKGQYEMDTLFGAIYTVEGDSVKTIFDQELVVYAGVYDSELGVFHYNGADRIGVFAGQYSTDLDGRSSERWWIFDSKDKQFDLIEEAEKETQFDYDRNDLSQYIVSEYCARNGKEITRSEYDDWVDSVTFYKTFRGGYGESFADGTSDGIYTIEQLIEELS